MTRRLVTISYTGLNSGGGVPKFNRDLHSAFHDRQCLHFCWFDFPYASQVDSRGETEWGRAALLNSYLISSRLITHDDVIVADGFWASGLETFPYAISHSHGIWSHLTHEDVLAGRQPDMPAHHAAQVTFRQRWSFLRKHLTAVSKFIAHELDQQWKIRVDRIINNAVDPNVFDVADYKFKEIPRPLIIHGVNDPHNINKGADHIKALCHSIDAKIMSLDEAVKTFAFFSDDGYADKAKVLAQADMFVHPSGFEGNSMMVAEALSCGLPFAGYNVGLMWELQQSLTWPERVGVIENRSMRSPEQTVRMVEVVLEMLQTSETLLKSNARQTALKYCSIDRFRADWRSYVDDIENA